MQVFRWKRKAKIKAAPIAALRRGQVLPEYLKSLVATVEEDWELPDPAQYQNCLEQYLDDILLPLSEMEEALDDKRIQFRIKVQRMREIAPDLFEKALRRTAFEAGYLLREDEHDVHPAI